MNPMKGTAPISWRPVVSRSRVVKSQKIYQRRFVKEVIFFLSLLISLALIHVGIRVQTVETGYRIRRLADEQESLRGENYNLKVELAMLRSPVRLEKIAGGLGLKKPPEKQITLITAREP